MHRYLETFYRHRKALLTPVIVALVVSVAFVAVQPRTYQAKAQLWFNSTAVVGEASQADQNRTPAQVGQGVFQELLQTRSFCVSVGRQGPLASYMQNGHMPSDPLSAATGQLDALRGKPPVNQQQKVDDAVQSLLQKQVKTSVTGSQIVTVTFDYSNPDVAAGTLQELTKEFSDQVLTAQRVRNQQQLDQLNQQVAYAQKQVAANDAAATQYVARHPELATAGSDSTYQGLQQVADQAHQQLAQATQQRDQAQVRQNQLQKGSALDFRVIDPANIPDRSQSYALTLLAGAVAGLAIGVMIAVVALVALVLADRTFRTASDVEQALGLKVVGQVPLRPTAKGRGKGSPSLGSDRRPPMLDA